MQVHAKHDYLNIARQHIVYVVNFVLLSFFRFYALLLILFHLIFLNVTAACMCK